MDDETGRQPSGRGPGPLDRRWLWVAVPAAAALIAAVIGGVNAFESGPESEDEVSSGPAPPREYGGPLWFTVGNDEEPRLVTHASPAGDGSGVPTTATLRYLSEAQCFTDGTHLLVWPRGSRPLRSDGTAGVAVPTGTQLLSGDDFRATAELLTIDDAVDFPPVESACAAEGTALVLSDVEPG